MFLAAISLAHLIATCAAGVNPRTMTALVRVESGGDSLVMHDNTWRTSYSAPDTATAVTWAGQLLALGHSVDLGLSQINSGNLPSLGLTVNTVFDPCTNLQAGATILSADYRAAMARFGPGQIALRHALGAYNTGSLYAGQGYINQILVAAGLPPEYDTSVASDPPPGVGTGGGTGAEAAAKPKKKRATATPAPMYTLQRTAGSPVDVIVGTP
jgi:type IV secretion system protein VirB1